MEIINQELKQMYEEFFETVSEHWRQILKLYKKFEDKKPIMLIDVQEKKYMLIRISILNHQ